MNERQADDLELWNYLGRGISRKYKAEVYERITRRRSGKTAANTGARHGREESKAGCQAGQEATEEEEVNQRGEARECPASRQEHGE